MINIDEYNSRVTLKINYKKGLLEKIERFLNSIEIYGLYENELIKNKLTDYDELFKIINVNETSNELMEVTSIKHENTLELRFDLNNISIKEFVTKIKKAGLAK